MAESSGRAISSLSNGKISCYDYLVLHSKSLVLFLMPMAVVSSALIQVVILQLLKFVDTICMPSGTYVNVKIQMIKHLLNINVHFADQKSVVLHRLKP